MTRRSARRDPAELVTLALSALAVLAVVGGLLTLELAGPDGPATFTLEPALAGTRERDGRFHLPVTVRNTGGRAAESVEVVATQRAGDREVEARTVVDFLSPGADARIVLVLGADPRTAAPRIEVRVYRTP